MITLTDLLLFFILVTLATYTFMPWKGIDKGSGFKLYGQWFIWFTIFGVIILVFNSVINPSLETWQQCTRNCYGQGAGRQTYRNPVPGTALLKM